MDFTEVNGRYNVVSNETSMVEVRMKGQVNGIFLFRSACAIRYLDLPCQQIPRNGLRYDKQKTSARVKVTITFFC